VRGGGGAARLTKTKEGQERATVILLQKKRSGQSAKVNFIYLDLLKNIKTTKLIKTTFTGYELEVVTFPHIALLPLVINGTAPPRGQAKSITLLHKYTL
jgi:hypothetical protein